ncbi:Phosphotransferase enzyme family protein [Actinokineospora alba]|uniref:Phosphotransferase enzyme family protein n=1 Tax=Actinokineospora alba TaxID=504798 RepID=A0A1H0WAM6_9PSEU|nr:aminoglycoside phosphotransferase family protein [Actinokineospora alba]TDP66167.1 phosphotransferase family enzyme [Actinokineospora alba]SDJ41986.1 Phosphotransferase enzyme family protein [Actinokineospora alba]SDP87762.1 Phosphotransferase enzyme family protein [Actinokineospora alba]
MVTGGLFTRENLRNALAAVCSEIGFDDRGARLLRFTNNAVFELATAPVVVRIVGSVALRHRVAKVVRVATWFAEHDVPAVRLLPGLCQPVLVGEYTATVWHSVPAHASTPRPADLARLLRRVHGLPPPEALPVWNPLDDVRRRLGEADGLDFDELVFLRERCDLVESRLAELEYALPAGFVHGDAHLGNLIPSPLGPVLCDFDSSCVGPPEWDLTPLAVGVRRFGEDAATYAELAEAYGFDVTRWVGYPVLCEVRELKLITSALPIMKSSPEVRPELLRRLRDFRSGETSTPWSRYT